jgi:hypothetical protein
MLERVISRECNDIIGSAKGAQISEKYWGEVGKRKKVDAYRVGQQFKSIIVEIGVTVAHHCLNF